MEQRRSRHITSQQNFLFIMLSSARHFTRAFLAPNPSSPFHALSGKCELARRYRSGQQHIDGLQELLKSRLLQFRFFYLNISIRGNPRLSKDTSQSIAKRHTKFTVQ
ncbi:hypothetical protein Fmac_021589 [Flemingia macrophylla]|uniref:Uncharacterized protein n=1 Tax=Flemingia macrophylla TaxID=520843 RepID=A0ABD1LXB2_9FABA